MRTPSRLALLVLVPASLAAQQPKPKATPVANTTKMTALDNAASKTINDMFDAFVKADAARLNAAVADGAINIGYQGIGTVTSAELVQMAKSCTTRSWSVTDVHAKQIAPNIVAATYKATVDQTCDGKVQPPNYFVSDILENRNGRWVSVMHQETVAKP